MIRIQIRAYTIMYILIILGFKVLVVGKLRIIDFNNINDCLET